MIILIRRASPSMPAQLLNQVTPSDVFLSSPARIKYGHPRASGTECQPCHGKRASSGPTTANHTTHGQKRRPISDYRPHWYIAEISFAKRFRRLNCVLELFAAAGTRENVHSPLRAALRPQSTRRLMIEGNNTPKEVVQAGPMPAGFYREGLAPHEMSSL